MPFVVSEGSLVSTSSPAGTSHLAPTRTPSSIAGFLGRTLAYDAVFRSQPHVRTVVGWLMRQAASIKLNLFRELDERERERVRGTPAAKLFDRPNYERSRHAFYRDLVGDLSVFDTFYAVKLKADRPSLVRIPPTLCAPIGKSWLEPEAFALFVKPGGRGIEVAREDVVYLHGYHPTDPRVGTSSIEALRLRLAEDYAAGEHRERTWRNGARVSGVIRRPADAPRWSDTARERFLEEWGASWVGDAENAGGTPVLEEGMTYEKLTLTASELEYVEARKLTAEETAAAYFVDPGVVFGGTTGDAGAANRRSAIADTLGPLLDFIAGELAVELFIDLGLGLDGDHYLEHNLEAKLRGHFLEQAEVISRSVGGPWLARNEARAMFNRPPIDGADELIVPLNVTAGGRASPADTAPGTPGLGQASAFIDIGGELHPIYERKALERGAKANGPTPGDELPDNLKAWLTPTVTLVERLVGRARRSTLSRLRAGDRIGGAFDRARWQRELAADALELAKREASDLGGELLAELEVDDDYNVDGAEAWLKGNAGIFAEGFVAALEADLVDAYSDATKSLTKADGDDEEEPDPVVEVDHAFALFLTGRALVEAATRVATVGNFARYDAAQQAGAGSKTWRTGSTNPRAAHAKLAGVTVPIGETFPNGALWPGDPVLPAEERANCSCTFDVTIDD